MAMFLENNGGRRKLSDLKRKLLDLKPGGQWKSYSIKKSKAFGGHYQKLDKLKHAKRDDPNLVELIDRKIQLNLKIDKDERYWEQRAHINWLKYGDRNTVFFHSQATHRRRINLIHKLQDGEGREIEIIQDIEGIARSYFQNLFMSEERGSCDHLLLKIDRCISEEDNQFLTDKGFKQANSTHIVLIPKVANPVNMKQFRPISLCNVIYKIMTKAIANRLRGVIEKCIDVAQSAFVPGRLISDNVFLAYEILYTLK
ncbi:reverse transcriptase [Gossypium australe]|uniref:Reverse transcriptase n=1 Tax=Gossypium australe TaxID=47621 RepID=A0A5B6WXC1_9ROSI|nr:reverse transcriptase [Gossypium australe]